MRLLLPSTFLLLACVECVAAFYPYHLPTGDGDGQKQSRGTESRRAGGGTAPVLPLKRIPVVGRDNEFNIVSGRQPSQTDSMAVATDGTDYTYMGAVKLG